MTPEYAIANLAKIGEVFEDICAPMAEEIERIEAAWKGLGKVGGQRADHAAALLGKLRPYLLRVAAAAKRVEQQLADMEAHPFGKKEGANVR